MPENGCEKSALQQKEPATKKHAYFARSQAAHLTWTRIRTVPTFFSVEFLSV